MLLRRSVLDSIAPIKAVGKERRTRKRDLLFSQFSLRIPVFSFKIGLTQKVLKSLISRIAKNAKNAKNHRVCVSPIKIGSSCSKLGILCSQLQQPRSKGNTNSINDCNICLGKDAIHRVSTNGLFVAFFFQIGINYGE